MPRFAVVVCSDCKTAFSIELRHDRTTCARCGRGFDVARRQRFWQGDDAVEAARVAGDLRGTLHGADPEAWARTPVVAARHDSPVDAAAAKARGITNKSARAEEIALWLTRLKGTASDQEYLEAMGKAGIDGTRAEKEVIRMLACDVIYEPAAGRYATLEA